METKTNSKAIWSFVLSLVGLFFAGIILGIIALVMGGNALKEIETQGENHEAGAGLAKAAKIIGIIDIVGGVIGGLLILMQ